MVVFEAKVMRSCCPSIRTSSIRTRNNNWRRLHLSPVPNCGGGVPSRGLICTAAAVCFADSDVSTKEELDVQDAEFSAVKRSFDGGRRDGLTLHYLEERDEKALSRRLVSLSRSNKVQSAMELFLSMEAMNLTPDPHSCNSLLSCLLRNGLLSDALEVFDKMSERDLTTGHSYTLVLKGIADNRGFDAAIELFGELERDDRVRAKGKLDVIVYNTMISVCAKAKNWVEVEKLWRKLGKSNVRGSSLTYDLLVSAFVQCSCTELAIEAYRESLGFGIEPSEATMKAIVATCTQEGHWELAVSVLRKMLDRGIKPNLIAFNSVINCLGKAGRCKLAFRVYQSLKSLSLQPDMYTWYALISALYRSGKYFEVIELFQWVKLEAIGELDAHIYNVVLLACQKQGTWAQALQLLWEMENSKIEVPVQSYNHVMFACEEAGEVNIALRVYRRMVQRGCNGDDFTNMSLIRCSIRGALWDEFFEILKDIPSYSSVYYSTIQELCTEGNIETAKKLHVKMLKLGLQPDARTSALMLQYFGKQ